MRHMYAKLGLPVALAVMVGACGDTDMGEYEIDDDVDVAEERSTSVAFAEWDADQSDFLDENEFDAWWGTTRYHVDWDADGEQGLTRDEYAGGVFTLWDRNDDDRIDEDEWRQGAVGVYGPEPYDASWADWDMDGDSELDLNEVREGLERENLYDRVDGDADALIDDEELADWFFDLFDTDDDREIDTTEWESTWFESEHR